MRTSEEFFARVKPGRGCLLWTGGRGGGRGQDYGVLKWRGKVMSAHRVALELAGVEVPEGHDAHHVCENKLCVRVGPGHLMVLPHGEHSREHDTLSRVSHPSRGPHAAAWRAAIARGQQRRRSRERSTA